MEVDDLGGDPAYHRAIRTREIVLALDRDHDACLVHLAIRDLYAGGARPGGQEHRGAARGGIGRVLDEAVVGEDEVIALVAVVVVSSAVLPPCARVKAARLRAVEGVRRDLHRSEAVLVAW
eukprot:CAMPEP_0167817586 /NCGR_PEP_ID=MMETSP0112_2-20121227/4283_1 /TAXON_ID=91324 /ORGANISM="Lotharella globosa, Strain CCCM811" /LENGTH=120 /DNA_ID=CAMNT_0007717379 /DNA_START=104 /DNA_END=463 /DNA_ORIENTATION=+